MRPSEVTHDSTSRGTALRHSPSGCQLGVIWKSLPLHSEWPSMGLTYQEFIQIRFRGLVSIPAFLLTTPPLSYSLNAFAKSSYITSTFYYSRVIIILFSQRWSNSRPQHRPVLCCPDRLNQYIYCTDFPTDFLLSFSKISKHMISMLLAYRLLESRCSLLRVVEPCWRSPQTMLILRRIFTGFANILLHFLINYNSRGLEKQEVGKTFNCLLKI